MSLPPHVRRGTRAIPARPSWRLNAQDARDFLIAYTACFVCVTAFIS